MATTKPIELVEKFIELYKKCEAAIPRMKAADADSNMYWLESQINDNDAKDKIRMCRLTRNYIQHHEDYVDFIQIHPNMISFLQNLLEQIQAQELNCEETMIPSVRGRTVNTILTCHSPYKACSRFAASGLQALPVLDEKGMLKGFLTAEDMFRLAADISSRKETSAVLPEKYYKKTAGSISILKKDESYRSAISALSIGNLVCVTNNGTAKEPVLGFFSKQR